MFLETNKDLGTIRANVEQKFEYEYTDEVDYIMSVTGCDCANRTVDPTEHKIKFSFTPPPVPRHLAKLVTQGYYLTKKSYEVKAMLKEGMMGISIISFEATVTN